MMMYCAQERKGLKDERSERREKREREREREDAAGEFSFQKLYMFKK